MKNNWRRDALVAIIFLMGVLFYFWRLITPNDVDRAIFINSDFNLQFYPWLKFVFGQWSHRTIPLWNPYLNGGQPGLADIQLGALYPINLLIFGGLILTHQPFTPLALVMIILLHVWMAAFFTYLLARRVTGNRWGGLVAGGIFAFSGYITTFATIQLTVLQVATWLPLLLFLLDRAWEHQRTKDYLLTGAAFAMAALAGHPQWFIYTTYVVLFFYLFRTLEHGGSWRQHFSWWRRLALTLGFGLALAAAQLLPTLEMFLHSQRAEELNYTYVSRGLPLGQLPGLILSKGMSQPLLFVGSVALLLAAWGIYCDWRKGKLWLSLGVTALLIAFGGGTVLHTLCYIALPGFSFVREQYRVLYILVLAVSVLAGLGVSRLTQGQAGNESAALSRCRQVALWGLASAGAAIILLQMGMSSAAETKVAELLEGYGLLSVVLSLFVGILTLFQHRKLSTSGFRALLVGLLILEIFSPNWQSVMRDAPPAGLFPATPLTQIMQQNQAELFRISSESLLPDGPNSATVYGLQDVLGYTPLRLQYRADFEQQSAMPETKFWGLFNVRYLLTRRDFGNDGRFKLLAQEGETNLYSFWGNEYLPRVYMIHDAVVVPQEEAWSAVAENDPRQTTTLVEPLPFALSKNEECQDEIHIIDYQALTSKVQVHSDCNSLLVFSEVFYPGWRATLDDQRTPIYRANGLFRAVAVPAGNHQVQMRFVPLSFWVGVSISSLTLLVGIGLLFRPRKKSR